MRIVSGSHKGKRISAPRNLPVRPTTDFAKEGLFNILNNRFDFNSIEVLDLFAGTGNISYEFASRGVPGIVAVDAHFGCVKFIQKTSEELDFPISTIKSDVFKFLEKTPQSYDIIFADPPYSFTLENFSKIVEISLDRSLLKPDGYVIIEHPKQIDMKETEGFQESRRYGGSGFSFFSNTL